MTLGQPVTFSDSTEAPAEVRPGRADGAVGRLAFWIVAAWTILLVWSMGEIHAESKSILREIWGPAMDDPYLARYRPTALTVWSAFDPCLSSGFLCAVLLVPLLGGVRLVQRRLAPLQARWVPWGLLGLGLVAVVAYTFAFFTLLMLPLGRL